MSSSKAISIRWQNSFKNLLVCKKLCVEGGRREEGSDRGEMKVKRGVMWWLESGDQDQSLPPTALLSVLSQSPWSPHHTTPHHTTPHMELTTSTPSHCILQVLLVSPPPPPHHSHHSRHIEPKQSKNHNQTNSKPFSPWKPGDAYSVEQDLSDWRLLLGSIEDGDQTRWDTASDMMVVCSVRFSQSNSRIETHSHLSSQTNHPQINNRIIVDCCCCIEYLILANFIIMLNICKSKFV